MTKKTVIAVGLGLLVATLAIDTASAQSRTLTVTVTGSGTVTSEPAGIDCGADCSQTYATGTVAILTPTPAPGSAFLGWSGAADCRNEAQWTTTSALAWDQNDADADALAYALYLDGAPQGSLRTVSCDTSSLPAACTGAFPSGFAPAVGVYLLQIEAERGGIPSGRSAGMETSVGGETAAFPIRVTMDANRSCSATFGGGGGGANQPPVAVGDAYVASLDTTLVVATADGVLANDSDPDLDAFDAQLVSGVSRGVLTLNGNGSFSYTPAVGYVGPDSFVYRAVDSGALASNPATVSINVVDGSGGPPPLDPDTVTFLPLNEGVGIVAGDLSGFGHDGILLNGAAFQTESPDESAFSVGFDGVDDRVDLGLGPDLTGSGLTFATWFKADGFPGRSHFVAKGNWSILGTQVVNGTPRLRGRVRAGGRRVTFVATAGDLSPDVWHHAALTYDGTRVRLFLDGAEVASQGLTGPLDWGSQPMMLGGNSLRDDRDGFDGRLDDVHIVQRAFTESDLAVLMMPDDDGSGPPPPGGPPPADPDTLVYLPLDEGAGSVAGDLSGLGHDGILTNGARFRADSPDGSASSVRFDGVNDRVDLGLGPDVTGSGLTFATWFKADGFSGRSHFVAKGNWSILGTEVVNGTPRLRGRVRAGGQRVTFVATAGNLSPGMWHHAALTYDGSRMRLFLDGAPVGSQALTGPLDWSSHPMMLGGNALRDDRDGFDGRLDDVRIIERGLTEAEVAGLMGAGTQTAQATMTSMSSLVGNGPTAGGARRSSPSSPVFREGEPARRRLPTVADFRFDVGPGTSRALVLGPASLRRGFLTELGSSRREQIGAHAVVRPEFSGREWVDVLRVFAGDGPGAGPVTVDVRVSQVSSTPVLTVDATLQPGIEHTISLGPTPGTGDAPHGGYVVEISPTGPSSAGARVESSRCAGATCAVVQRQFDGHQWIDVVTVTSTSADPVTANIRIYGVDIQTVEPARPAAQIDAIRRLVDAVGLDGRLASPEHSFLRARLDDVASQIAAGQSAAAQRLLAQFVQDVQGLVQNGVMSSAQGAALAGPAVVLANQLSRVP